MTTPQHPNPIHWADVMTIVKEMPNEKVSQLMDSMAGKSPLDMTQDEFMLYIQSYDAETIAETPEEFFRLLAHHGIYR